MRDVEALHVLAADLAIEIMKAGCRNGEEVRRWSMPSAPGTRSTTWNSNS